MIRRHAVLTLLLVAGLAACAEDDPARPSATTSPSASIVVSPTPTAADPTPSPSPADDHKTVEVSVAAGKVTRKSSTFEVRRGDKVRIVVTSDTADEVHLHTYDVKVPVAPGQPATLEFTATISGQFEVELENAGLLLLTVAVR